VRRQGDTDAKADRHACEGDAEWVEEKGFNREVAKTERRGLLSYALSGLATV
jgi:hypothetical protein